MLGGAAGPLGGDQLRYEIDIVDGADLRMKTVAASVVLAGTAPSSTAIDATVGSGAHLDWFAQPLVSTARSRHSQSVTLRLADDASLRWREDIVWGRSEEPGGRLSAGIRVVRDGTALLHQDLELGGSAPGWAGLGGLASARVVATELLVGLDVEVEPEPIVDVDGAAVACELADGVWLLQSVGISHRRTADRLVALRRER